MFPSSPTAITLADGKPRHLRYSLGAVKRIKEKWGKTFDEIVKHPAEELLPAVLMEGLVEKEGITETVILEELLTGPMIDDVMLIFIRAFFGVRQAEVVEQIDQTRRALLKTAVEASLKATAPEPTTTVQ
jgi:hypothetical protein